MNPPFSEFKKHFLHAWEIAPEGCEVVCLCNNNYLGYTSTEITKLIENYGYSQNLGNVFEDAERSTNTEIGLIKVYKPMVSESINFDDYFDEIDTDIEVQGYGLVKYNEIDSLINNYKGIIKVSENLFKDAGLLKKMGEEINLYFDFVIGVKISDSEVNKQQFLKLVQEQMWRKVFNMFNIEKYITSGVMSDIKAWIDRKGNTPFTKRNIFKMIEIIYGTKNHNFKRGLIEAVDKYTRHTKDNRYSVEGWSSNSGYLLNKKFIVPYMCESSYKPSKVRIGYSSYIENFNDLLKVLCNIEGRNYDNIKRVNAWTDFERGIWHDMDFFQYKGFKKGTMHFKFKDDKVWERLNRAYAEAKGKVLPEKI
ncbi:DUF4942 domain-containing protein [Riemerella columbina]|uniref:DUF4942 domain-containing protein n=1 Tax=Riemerella columbina TaxID=103810 RepID=UPI00316ADA71